MSRQINLLNPALIRQRDYLNAQLLVYVSALVLVLVLVVYGYMRYRVSELRLQRDQASQQLKDTQLQLAQVVQLHAPRQPSKPLKMELDQAENGLKNRQKLLVYLQGNEFGSRRGFSGYMQAFAVRGVKGLWLTDFAIDDSAGQITIGGRALQPDLIPQYIAGLGKDPLLKGREFSALQIHSVELAPEHGATTAVAGVAATKPVVTEFKLQSVEKNASTADGQSAGQVGKKP